VLGRGRWLQAATGPSVCQLRSGMLGWHNLRAVHSNSTGPHCSTRDKYSDGRCTSHVLAAKSATVSNCSLLKLRNRQSYSGHVEFHQSRRQLQYCLICAKQTTVLGHCGTTAQNNQQHGGVRHYCWPALSGLRMLPTWLQDNPSGAPAAAASPHVCSQQTRQ
jgi:hypothetical protein